MSEPPRVPLDSQLGFFSKYRLSSFEQALSLRSVPLRNVSLSISLSASLSVYLPFLFSSLSFPRPVTRFISPALLGEIVSFTVFTNLYYIHRGCKYWKTIKSYTRPARPFLVCWNKRTPTPRKKKPHSFTPSPISSDTDWALRQHQLLKCEFWNCLGSWWGLHGLLFLRKLRCIFCCGDTPSADPIHFDWIGSQKLQRN